jgi:pyruvate,water dikinase
MADLLWFDSITPADASRVGGKAASLAAMAANGLPVPPGFALTTDAYRRLHSTGIRSDAGLATAVRDAFRKLGGAVAVRSSATDEDGTETSFAGQQETVLGVETEDGVLDAIERCWGSLHTERAVAYRQQQGVSEVGVAMAVVVQKLVPADSAGVLFTQDPTDPTAGRMVVEAAFGLGEVVVSGRVTPDRYVIEKSTSRIVERHLGKKSVRVVGGREERVPTELQQALCLSDTAVVQLAELGGKVEAFVGHPRDIEWAIANDELFLLQARPITTTGLDRKAVRTEVIASLKPLADPRGTVWVRYNLSEILPRPTPMTWAVLQQLLAADGGIGLMNRDLGCRPDPALNGQGAFDLVAGRPMANLSRMPRLQLRHPPFEFPFATFRDNPELALDPKAVLNPLRDGAVKGLLRLPATVWRLWRMASIARKEADTFADRFRSQIVPRYVRLIEAARAEDWSNLGDQPLLAKFEEWVRLSLVEFARHSLKPTVLAENAWATVVSLLQPTLGQDEARAAAAEFARGVTPDPETDLASAFRDLATGTTTRESFLERFGHRAANEMELAALRWNEQPPAPQPLPVGPSMHAPTGDGIDAVLERFKLAPPLASAVRKQALDLRTYLGLRESAKHYLLMGYALVRRALVELGRRFELGDRIFYLLPAELPQLVGGQRFDTVIRERMERRKIELTLEVPAVLFSTDLEAIGRPAAMPEGATKYTGTPLSAGVAEGPAFVLTEPTNPPEISDGFVLVCPSTDPAWVPLFARATALVMETGGVLSHGAIVAREFGLPAVAGLPDITRQLRTGQRVCVDGRTGIVAVLET